METITLTPWVPQTYHSLELETKDQFHTFNSAELVHEVY